MPRAEKIVECVERDDYVQARIKTDPRNHRYKVGCLNEFLAYCDTELSHHSVFKVTKKNVEQFSAYLISRRGARSTIAGKMRLIFAWFKWLEDEGRLPKNPCRKLEVNDLVPAKPGPMSTD